MLILPFLCVVLCVCLSLSRSLESAPSVAAPAVVRDRLARFDHRSPTK